MSGTLPLLRKRINLETALDEDENLLALLEYPRQQEDFWSYLLDRKHEIEATVSFHLGLKHCQIADSDRWLAGSFNACIPVFTHLPTEERVLIRIPLPYKVGEAQYPGNVDEKLRCEAAAYIHIQDICPEVPVPKLWGFGFKNGQSFTTPENVPFITRCLWTVRRYWLSFRGRGKPCRYVRRASQPKPSLETGYLILSVVENGQMLSNTWFEHRKDSKLRSNLFHGLARILLSLNRSHHPRIGSLRLDERGILALTNRPLTLRLQIVENEGISRVIDRYTIYSTVEPYILDYLSCHDRRLLEQPNAIHHKDDGEQQMAALAMMRSLLPHFTLKQYREGPFVFALTDLHQSNIFVDDDWNITSLIDLEWAAVLPIQSQTHPYWITGRPIDDLERGEALDEFSNVTEEYLDIYEEEENKLPIRDIKQTSIMRQSWESGAYWYFHGVHSLKGMFRLFNHHLQYRFCPDHVNMAVYDQVVHRYWDVDAEGVIEKKIKDEATYKEELTTYFRNHLTKTDNSV